MKRISGLFAIILVVILAGCAKPPQAEIDAAKAAVAKAQGNVDVVAYAPDGLKRAQDLLAAMQGEAQSKKYDKAKASAIAAKTAAETAESDALTNKERVKSEAQALIDEVRKAFPDLEKTLSQARRVSGVKLDFKALVAEIAALKTGATAAEADMGSGNFLAAKAKASDIKAKIADIQMRISEAVQVLTRKK